MESCTCRCCRCRGGPPPPHRHHPCLAWERDGWLGRSAFTLTKRPCLWVMMTKSKVLFFSDLKSCPSEMEGCHVLLFWLHTSVRLKQRFGSQNSAREHTCNLIKWTLLELDEGFGATVCAFNAFSWNSLFPKLMRFSFCFRHSKMKGRWNVWDLMTQRKYWQTALSVIACCRTIRKLAMKENYLRNKGTKRRNKQITNNKFW